MQQPKVHEYLLNIKVVLNTLAVPAFAANEKKASNEVKSTTSLLYEHMNPDQYTQTFRL